LDIEAKWTECIICRDRPTLPFRNLRKSSQPLHDLRVSKPVCTEVGARDQARGNPIKIGSSGESVGRFRALTHQKAPPFAGFRAVSVVLEIGRGFRMAARARRKPANYPQPVHTFLSGARGMCLGPRKPPPADAPGHAADPARARLFCRHQDQDRSACFIRRCEAVDAISRHGCVAPDAHSIPLGNLVGCGSWADS
jgi:hypothetical protein